MFQILDFSTSKIVSPYVLPMSVASAKSEGLRFYWKCDGSLQYISLFGTKLENVTFNSSLIHL